MYFQSRKCKFLNQNSRFRILFFLSTYKHINTHSHISTHTLTQIKNKTCFEIIFSLLLNIFLLFFPLTYFPIQTRFIVFSLFLCIVSEYCFEYIEYSQLYSFSMKLQCYQSTENFTFRNDTSILLYLSGAPL